VTGHELVRPYTEALDAEMRRLGYDTFRRTDENGIEHVCFLLPVNDNGEKVFTELCVFGMNEYSFCMQLYSTVTGKFENNLTELEKAICNWNLNSFGTYGIFYPAQNLYHRQINVLDASDSPEKAARLAFYTIAIIREEINSRLPVILDYISADMEDTDETSDGR
jgi:hypothetical protein